MTERYLVTCFKSDIKKGIRNLEVSIDAMENLADMERIQKRLELTAQNVKTVLDMFESYVAVDQQYNKKPNSEEDG